MDPEAGVVDADVHRPPGVTQPLGDAQHVLTLAQVGGDHLGLDGVAPGQRGGRRVQPRRVPRHEDEVVAAGSELAGEGIADAGRRTRDQGGGTAAFGRSGHVVRLAAGGLR